MWLNSFYKAPLRLPMLSELEYWWAKDDEPEFVLINKEPEPNPEDPSQPIYDEDPLILHTPPTGRLMGYVDDEEHGIRLFWQPPMKEGEQPNPDEAEFLPLGFDEFYGREVTVPQDNWWIRLVKSMESKGTAIMDGLEKWAEEKEKAGETKIEMLKKEVELMEAEMDLKEAIEDLDEELKMLQQEEENKVEEEEGVEEEEETTISEPATKAEADQTTVGGEAEVEDEDQEEEDDDDATASSFGSVGRQSSTNKNEKGSGFGKSTFAASSLTFVCSNIVSLVPRNLQNQFLRWKEGRFQKAPTSPTYNLHEALPELLKPSNVGYPLVGRSLKMRCTAQRTHQVQNLAKLSSRNRAKSKGSKEAGFGVDLSILSFHTPPTIT